MPQINENVTAEAPAAVGQVQSVNHINEPKAKKPAPKAAAKPKAKPAPAKKPAKASGSHDGAAVGYFAKSTQDCRWNATRVAFYRALRKIGGSGTAAAIAAASKGEISVGNCLNYGYRGAAAKLNNVQKLEGERHFTFVLTAKGKTIDLDKVLEKQGKNKGK